MNMPNVNIPNVKPGNLVWAKFDDYPFWPARVATSAVGNALRNSKKEPEKIAVLFFGDPLLYGLVAADSIVDFETGMEKYKRGDNSKEFKLAFEQAKNASSIADPPLEIEYPDHKAKKQKITKIYPEEHIGEVKLIKKAQKVEAEKPKIDEPKTEMITEAFDNKSENDDIKADNGGKADIKADNNTNNDGKADNKANNDQKVNNDQKITEPKTNSITDAGEDDLKVKDYLKEEVKNDIKDQVKEEMKEDVKNEVKEEMKEEVKKELKEDVKKEVKEDVKEKVKDDVKEEMKDDIKKIVKQSMNNSKKEL